MIYHFDIQATEDDPTEPVTLDEVKEYMRVDFTDDDDVILSMLKSARQLMEKKLNKALVPKSVTLTFDATCAEEPVFITYATNATAVVVTDVENDEVLASDEYKMTPGLFRANWAGSFNVQWTETPTVDANIKEAIKMLVAYRYNNRGDQNNQQGTPADIDETIKANYVPCL